VKDIKNLVLIGPAHPYRGGIAHFNESLARSLEQEGVDVTLVSFSLQYPSILFPGKSQYTDAKSPADLKIKRWISSVNPVSWISAARKIAELKPDLVVIRYWHPFLAPALGSIASRLVAKNIKVIGMVDNAIPHEPKFYDIPLLKYFARRCTAFFTLSNAVAKELNALGLNKAIETSPHPIYDIFGEPVDKQLARKKLKLNQHDKIILFFGFVRAYKGLDLLIQALGLDLVRRLKIKLIVAGEFYDEKKKYMDLIDSLDLSDTIIIYDEYIPESDVKYFFGAADLVTQTYKTATQSGVTQIAYQFNKPMLVTDVGGLSEIVENEVAGFVVPPEPEAIASALQRYFGEAREAPFISAVKKNKERFSWTFFTQKLISFAQSL